MHVSIWKCTELHLANENNNTNPVFSEEVGEKRQKCIKCVSMAAL